MVAEKETVVTIHKCVCALEVVLSIEAPMVSWLRELVSESEEMELDDLLPLNILHQPRAQTC